MDKPMLAFLTKGITLRILTSLSEIAVAHQHGPIIIIGKISNTCTSYILIGSELSTLNLYQKYIKVALKCRTQRQMKNNNTKQKERKTVKQKRKHSQKRIEIKKKHKRIKR